MIGQNEITFWICYSNLPRWRTERLNKLIVKIYIDEASDYKNYDYQNKLKNLLFAMKSREKY